MKLLLENLPPSLSDQRESLTRCLEAIGRAAEVRQIYLFGSHARGDARPDSDVDLCIVTDDAGRQLATAQKFRRAMTDIWPCPAFTLLPISTQRLAEKRAANDHFFATVLEEGVLLATEN